MKLDVLCLNVMTGPSTSTIDNPHVMVDGRKENAELKLFSRHYSPTCGNTSVFGKSEKFEINHLFKSFSKIWQEQDLSFKSLKLSFLLKTQTTLTCLEFLAKDVLDKF